MNKRVVGNAKEAIAVDYLKKNGFQIIEQNYFTRAGEIDIIAKDGDYLAFVEVKYRWNEAYGFPADAVHKQKQKKIIQCARYYMLTHGYSEYTKCRFDVVLICREEITMIQNAYNAF